MMETILPPDLPAFSSRAATGIRRSLPCAGAAFCAAVSQVITKPGPCAIAQGPFFRYRIPTRLFCGWLRGSRNRVACGRVLIWS